MSRSTASISILCCVLGCGRATSTAPQTKTTDDAAVREKPKIADVQLKVSSNASDGSSGSTSAGKGETLHVEGTYRLLPGAVPRPIMVQILYDRGGKEMVANSGHTKYVVKDDIVTFKGDINAPEKPMRYLLKGRYESSVVMEWPIDVKSD